MENNNRNNPGKCAAKVPPAYHRATQKYDVFISYSSHDQKVAEGVCAYLEQHRIRCFVAYRDIPKGVVWARAIVEALEESRMMVIVFSENFNRSEQVDREIELASEDHMPILTFRIADDAFRGAKKYYLKNLNWIDAFPQPERCFGELCKNVKQLLDIDKENTSEPEDAQTLYERGESYYYGEGVTQDYAEAVQWYRKAAELGHAEAQWELGCCYANGEGVAKNHAEAAKWFRKAAEQGHTEAQYELGCWLNHGIGVPKNYDEAISWFHKAAEQGHTDALLVFGRKPVNKQYLMAHSYDDGGYIPQNLNEIIPQIRKAAIQGNTTAQNQLGYCYAIGGGVVIKDYVKAEHWFRKAAEQGDARGQYNLGVCYNNGEGVPHNSTIAIQLFHKSAEQGLNLALYSLGRGYELGVYGLPLNHGEAIKWFRRAAEQGDVFSQFQLAYCYENGGVGVPKNLTEAAKWYRKAAEQGNNAALNMLKKLGETL